MENKKRLVREENLTPFKKGKSGNPNGRPKGLKNGIRTKLRKLIKDLIYLNKKIGNREKVLIYQIYGIAFTDLIIPKNLTSEINHLYFMESEIGIKIGKSKNVNERIKQINAYSPSARIIKIIEFAGGFETLLHRKFKDINIKGNEQIGIEWFYKNPKLLEFISEIDTIEDLARVFAKKNDMQLLLFE